MNPQGRLCRTLLLLTTLYLMTAIALPDAVSQSSKVDHANKPSGVAGAKKEMKFEVISIRQLKPGSPIGVGFTPNPTPDGFVSTLTIWQMLMVAYGPNFEAWPSIPVVNGPQWFYDHDAVWYVFNARVSDEDREAWRSQSNRHELLRSAMQAALKERCKLVIHEKPTLLPDYKLVIGKKGLKGLKATPPGAVLPSKGAALPTGGVRISEVSRGRTTWHYYDATIDELVAFLGAASPERPIHNETGLTGRYDFSLTIVDQPSRIPSEGVFNWPVNDLGLELRPGKYPSSALVIDHMEKPVLQN